MLSKAYRLPSSEIRGVLKKGHRFMYSPFQLICVKSNLPVSRFSFIVSTRVDQHATGRNRIRRLLQEAVRLTMPQITSGYDIVITAVKTPETLTIKATSEAVIQLLTKSQLLRQV